MEAASVATFYLLPPRRFVAEHLASYLDGVFPGLEWNNSSDLVEALSAAASAHSDVYVVHREDLPHVGDVRRALTEGFGAEEGDEVIEVDIGARAGTPTARSWRVSNSC
jgi:hypothetical protein